jgi:hypothetical protein
LPAPLACWPAVVAAIKNEIKENVMSRKTRCLLAVVLLCGIGRAGVSPAEDARFIGRLPQGITVELVGVANYRQTNQSEWWRADGSAARLGSFRPLNADRRRDLAKEKAIEFLIRIENPQNESKYVNGEIILSKADTSWPAWGINGSVPPASSWWEGSSVADVRGDMLPEHKMFAISLDSSTQTADFRVGISLGEWETVASRKPVSAGASSFSRNGETWTVTFHKLKAIRKASDDATQVMVSTTITWPAHYGKLTRRLMAVADDGSEHVFAEGDYNKENMNAVFEGLASSSIKELRFQVRPYYWVEFKYVSLQPGRNTEVTVVSSDDAEK